MPPILGFWLHLFLMICLGYVFFKEFLPEDKNKILEKKNEKLYFALVVICLYEVTANFVIYAFKVFGK